MTPNHLFFIIYSILFIFGCADQTVDPSDDPQQNSSVNLRDQTAGDQAGASAGEQAGDSAGEQAGDSAGEQAGNSAGETTPNAGNDNPPQITPPTDQPNIILIFADDLGYGHLGSYGQRDILTPNLDRLAAEGVRFTRFYSGAPWCPPARTSLLTGLHGGHTPLRGVGVYDNSIQIFPKELQATGYRTALFGKWGFNRHDRGSNITGPAPTALGFDEFVGFLTHRDAHVYYLDGTATNGNSPVSQTLFEGQGASLSPVQVPPNRYLPDEFLSRAINFIDTNRDQPFFLYFPSQLPHAELVAPPEGLAPYSVNGQSQFPETPFLGNPTYPDRVDQPYATLAAMITRFDRDVGQIIDRIDALGLTRNTVFLVLSDNGPHVAGGIEDHRILNGAPGLSGRKFDLYEGGIRVPFIAKWEGQWQSGLVIEDAHALWDLAPTIREITNLPPQETDGVSLASKLSGEAGSNHQNLYWETHNYGAQSLRTPNGYLYQEATLIEGNLKIMRVSEQATGTYALVFDLSQGNPIETVERSIANRLDSCSWLRGLTERLDQAHQNAPDGAFMPLGGRCQLIGSQGNDDLIGEATPDRIVGRAGNDTISAMDGDDQVYGGPGDDIINGNIGNDYVQGNTGNDTVYGGKGNDTVRGGQGNDNVYGNLGNDIIHGDKGNDTLYGGDGDDVYIYESLNDQITIQPDSSGNDELRCVNVRAVSERIEGNDLIFEMPVGGQIRLVNHISNQSIERITDCRP